MVQYSKSTNVQEDLLPSLLPALDKKQLCCISTVLGNPIFLTPALAPPPHDVSCLDILHQPVSFCHTGSLMGTFMFSPRPLPASCSYSSSYSLCRTSCPYQTQTEGQLSLNLQYGQTHLHFILHMQEIFLLYFLEKTSCATWLGWCNKCPSARHQQWNK